MSIVGERRQGDDQQFVAPPKKVGPDDSICLSLEAKLKRYCGVLHLVVPPNSIAAMVGKPNRSLLKAIERAHAWYAGVLEGNAFDQRSLARHAGFTERYAGEVFSCAFLAPDIVEAILQGRQPEDLTGQAPPVSLESTHLGGGEDPQTGAGTDTLLENVIRKVQNPQKFTLLTIPETALYFGVKVRTIHRWTAESKQRSAGRRGPLGLSQSGHGRKNVHESARPRKISARFFLPQFICDIRDHSLPTALLRRSALFA